MNSIQAQLDKSDYEAIDDFLNIRIDGFWLDEKLDSIYPGSLYKGLIPTLLFALEIQQEKDVVWKRILPKEKSLTIYPILMCPDDCDFSCTLIVAEVENLSDSIKWNRVGINRTTEFGPEKVGSDVEWFESVDEFTFDKNNYMEFVEVFKEQHQIDKLKWEKADKIFLNS